MRGLRAVPQWDPGALPLVRGRSFLNLKLFGESSNDLCVFRALNLIKDIILYALFNHSFIHYNCAQFCITLLSCEEDRND